MTKSAVEDLVCVGTVAGAFGVRGEVRLKSYCANPEDIELYSPLLTEDGSQSFPVVLTRSIKNGFAARLGGVETKDDADTLRGVSLFAPRDRLPALPEDEFYYSDLIGLEVLDTGGTSLGRVKDVQNHGAGDLLELQVPGQSATVLMPFTRAVVPTVDLEAGRLIADPPEGLF
ncbi:ribosome maturation factor RimM [Pseudodonghicola flavimaris]|uniref:Ribosome maturation factor RimM n=1 Tax=Pseudodonghicola flavimaris TaxID=3050036 RepID=A0ABT7F6N9_9RHOB|nr:ribosome maturation factor RimM [Pseudodonghicola flavimaris]MDK3020276.1 ribosome maturation factor RimM [Pseudodonghicola flavimaris]